MTQRGMDVAAERCGHVRIVAIDDNVGLLRMLEQMLARAGHVVAAYSRAVDGIAEIRRTMPDVVITDILMPDLDGVELIKSVRRASPDVWIVAISGGGRYMPGAFSLEMAEAFGADRTVYKPFRRTELLDAIVPDRKSSTARSASREGR